MLLYSEFSYFRIKFSGSVWDQKDELAGMGISEVDGSTVTHFSTHSKVTHNFLFPCVWFSIDDLNLVLIGKGKIQFS